MVRNERVSAFAQGGVRRTDTEWCADRYADDAYTATAASSPGRPAADPKGPAQGRIRTIRGGGWFNPAARNRSSQRVYFDPAFRYCLLSGFRVVRE